MQYLCDLIKYPHQNSFHGIGWSLTNTANLEWLIVFRMVVFQFSFTLSRRILWSSPTGSPLCLSVRLSVCYPPVTRRPSDVTTPHSILFHVGLAQPLLRPLTSTHSIMHGSTYFCGLWILLVLAQPTFYYPSQPEYSAISIYGGYFSLYDAKDTP